MVSGKLNSFTSLPLNSSVQPPANLGVETFSSFVNLETQVSENISKVAAPSPVSKLELCKLHLTNHPEGVNLSGRELAERYGLASYPIWNQAKKELRS